MAVFNVPRAGRQDENYTKNLIENMFYDERCEYKQGFGICCSSAEMIVYSFEAIRQTYCKINTVKIHYFELFIEYEIGLTSVKKMAEMIGRELYNYGFQSFVTAIDTGDRYLISVALNAVSFKDGELFHDNNACYLEIYQFLCNLLPGGICIEVTENTFFSPERRDGNYCHGEYM
ncbi:MAG: hypothetical protein IJA34_10425 [Lachnospiraceae bacterium]|nr:hypothetical protein [Lachnospiraceae bacterium]